MIPKLVEHYKSSIMIITVAVSVFSSPAIAIRESLGGEEIASFKNCEISLVTAPKVTSRPFPSPDQGRGPFEESWMLPHYWIMDRLERVRYFRANELSVSELSAENGRLVYANSIRADGSKTPFVASKGVWVMNGAGRVFGLNHSGFLTRHRHSTLLRKVAAAGELTTDSEGRLQEISRNSGHFQPSEEKFDLALARLIVLGVDFSATKVSYELTK